MHGVNHLFVIGPTVGESERFALRTALKHHFPTHGDEAPVVREIASDESIVEVVSALDLSRTACVVAVGGDGTVSAVAHVLANSALKLGIVPAGTGNLLARELGIPLSIEASVALLKGDNTTKRVDGMRIKGRTYLLNAGVGINAEVIDRTSRLGKSLFGRSAYVGTAVWKVLQAKPQRFEVMIDGQTTLYDATDIAISNCGILARGLNPNGPDIRMDDGLLDVSVFCMKTPLQYPWYYLTRLFMPQLVNRIMHEIPAWRSITIKSPEPVVVQADGDIIGRTPVTIEVMPKSINMVVMG